MRSRNGATPPPIKLALMPPPPPPISANLLFVSRLSIVSLRYSAGGLTSGRGLGTAGVVPAQ